MDSLDLYDRGSAWTASKLSGAEDKLDAPTPCDRWTVRALVNHMLDAQRRFTGAARGESLTFPPDVPPELLADDPVEQYERARAEALRAYDEPGVIEKTGPILGIAFVDQLIHGWDLATATGQDPTMPDDLARAAFGIVDGQLTDDRRGTAFKPPVPVPDDATAQERLLAYSGRRP